MNPIPCSVPDMLRGKFRWLRLAFILCTLVTLAVEGFGQENDNCDGAILIVPGTACALVEFDNTTATSEPITVAADPSCGSYTNDDVWFKIVVPASGALRIEVDRLHSGINPAFTVYSGSCENFQEIVCVHNDARRTITVPEHAGETIFVRVYSYYGISPGPSTICVYEPAVPDNNNCDAAIKLSVNESCELSEYSNAFATEEPGLVAPASCGYYKGGDIWFKIELPEAGIMWVSKNRIGGATHPAMAIYSGQCGSLTEILCSSNDPLVKVELPQYAGEEVYLRIYSYNNEEGARFSLCLFDDDAPVNDNCADATMLTVGESCVLSPYSNAMATDETPDVADNPTCGLYQGGDVWFRAVVPVSGKLSIRGETPFSSVPPSITVYTGKCGDFQEIRCVNNQNVVEISNSDLAGKTIFIRIYKFNSKDGGPFSLCLFESPCETIEHDAGEVRLCQGETYTLGSQVVSDEGTYEETFITQSGCDSLVKVTLVFVPINNGIVQQGNELLAEEDDATYQWKNCDSDKLVENASGKTFMPTISGKYSVIIKKDECVVESDCMPFTVVGAESALNVKIYPNPVSDVLYIETPDNRKLDGLQIINVNKQIVKEFAVVKNGSVDVGDLSAGVYFIRTKQFPPFRLVKK